MTDWLTDYLAVCCASVMLTGCVCVLQGARSREEQRHEGATVDKSTRMVIEECRRMSLSDLLDNEKSQDEEGMERSPRDTLDKEEVFSEDTTQKTPLAANKIGEKKEIVS